MSSKAKTKLSWCELETARGRGMYQLLYPYRPKGCKLVLDLGCANGMKASAYHSGLVIIGVEFNKAHAKEASKYISTCLHMDMRDIPNLFPKNSISWITLIDSLEHITQFDGVHLLPKLKVICRQAITVFTPYGNVEGLIGKRGGVADHKALWEPSHLRNLGFDVKELEGWHSPSCHAALAHWKKKEL